MPAMAHGSQLSTAVNALQHKSWWPDRHRFSGLTGVCFRGGVNRIAARLYDVPVGPLPTSSHLAVTPARHLEPPSTWNPEEAWGFLDLRGPVLNAASPEKTVADAL